MNSYQMVLHRPVEPASVIGKFTQRRIREAEDSENPRLRGVTTPSFVALRRPLFSSVQSQSQKLRRIFHSLIAAFVTRNKRDRYREFVSNLAATGLHVDSVQEFEPSLSIF